MTHSETGLFTFATNNLGDEMQSFAVLAHLDRVHRFLDRDRLAEHRSEADVACVFNSWFLLGDDVRVPAERILPIWHGFCGGREEIFQEPWLSYLKAQGPIGCRDLHTTERLVDGGVAAQWSGCLSLFLGRALRRPDTERNGVLFVDLPEVAEVHVPQEIRRRAVRLSTFPPPGIVDRPLARWPTVGRLVDALAQAELVVTRRLHVALPAASFGTPVVAIVDPGVSFARQRFSGFDTIVPTVYLDAAEAGLKRIDWHNLPPAQIPVTLEKRYAEFHSSVTSGFLVHGGAERQVGSRTSHVLDENGRDTQRLVNAAGEARPGRLRLTLADRTFELGVRFWCDQYVDVGLSGFPGLSKFEFQVECGSAAGSDWTRWGSLRDLVASAEPFADAFAAA